MDLSMNVLVVDDMASMRRIIKNILKSKGFTNIIEADDGTTALSQLKEKKFDLIISDWNMPQMTGIELLRTLRNMDEYKTVPFIMVTAEGQKQNVIDAVQSGVSQYIVKPFTPEQILQKLEFIFNK